MTIIWITLLAYIIVAGQITITISHTVFATESLLRCLLFHERWIFFGSLNSYHLYLSKKLERSKKRLEEIKRRLGK